jgi:DinB family protein
MLDCIPNHSVRNRLGLFQDQAEDSWFPQCAVFYPKTQGQRFEHVLPNPLTHVVESKYCLTFRRGFAMSTGRPHRLPLPTEFAPYQATYLKLVDELDILAALEKQLRQVIDEWSRIDSKTALVRHPPYTWSLNEVIGHLNDAERIFGYRALRFARGDTTELPSFEENDYVRKAEFDRCQWRSLIDEFQALRRANVLMLNNIPDPAWMNAGIAGGHRVTVHALAYVLVGHVRHHNNIIRLRLSQSMAVTVEA